MSPLSRREFLKRAGVIGASAAFNPSARSPIHSGKKEGRLYNLQGSDYPFPYDSEYFEAAERVVFIDPLQASVNVIPKAGKSLDIKLYVEQEDRFRLCQDKVFSYTGVSDSLDIPFENLYRDPFFTYRLEYKDIHEGIWKSTPERVVKTPCVSLEEKDIEIILVGDDHFPDDADDPSNPLQDSKLRNLRITGESVNYFLKKIQASSAYVPQGEERRLMNAFCLASFIHQIMLHENPDFITILGDHHGGFGHKWEGLGLKRQHATTEEERDQYVKTFRIATRKIFSALSPTIPIYWALGNHDGEAGFFGTRVPAIKYRKKYFKLPGESVGGAPDENYYSVLWGTKEGNPWLQERRRGGVQFIVLDCMRYNSRSPLKPEDWTLGGTQIEWFEQALMYEADWKCVLDHHVLGGWPAGSSELDKSYAYGRGPLFTAEDYRGFVNDPNRVEQVFLTRLMEEHDVDFNIYGHDHIFINKEIKTQRTRRKMYGLCVGTPKYIGELDWYKGEFWKRFYGDYGHYWGNAEKANFWGPAGYTKLTINRESVRIDYIRSAFNHPYTNVPSHVRVGEIIKSILI